MLVELRRNKNTYKITNSIKTPWCCFLKTNPGCNANQHGSVVNSLFQPPTKKMVLCQGPPSSALISSHCSDRSQRGKNRDITPSLSEEEAFSHHRPKTCCTITYEPTSAWRGFLLPHCLCFTRCVHTHTHTGCSLTGSCYYTASVLHPLDDDLGEKNPRKQIALDETQMTWRNIRSRIGAPQAAALGDLKLTKTLRMASPDMQVHAV